MIEISVSMQKVIDERLVNLDLQTDQKRKRPMTTYFVSGIYTAQIQTNTTRRLTRRVSVEIEAASEGEAIRETIDKLLFEVLDHGESMINENRTVLTAVVIKEIQ